MERSQIEELVKPFVRRLQMTPTDFHRYIYNKINWKDDLIGIKGPKGCGKTTLMLQHIAEAFPGEEIDKALYISLDSLWFSKYDVKDVVEYHYTHGGTHLFIDEVHYFPRWQTLLKNINDEFPGLKVVYTGSSMLQLERGEGDLSRRQIMYEMRGMSFREFLSYEGETDLEPVSLQDLLSNHVSLAMELTRNRSILKLFEQYLHEGYYPFYHKVYEGFESRLLSTVNQVIENDYPTIDDVTPSTIRKTKKLLMILAERVPQLPKMTEIYRELETDRIQGLKMLNALERGGLLLLLGDNAKSPNNLSRPNKIFINNTNLMYALTSHVDTGTLRETFFMNQLSQAHEVNYPNQGDFLVDKTYLFEVGGKGKSFNQVKDIPNSYLAVDETEIGHGNRIPLWMFGLLY